MQLQLFFKNEKIIEISAKPERKRKLYVTAMHTVKISYIWSIARHLTDCWPSFITGPPTHSVGGQTSNSRWCLSSSVICQGL